MEIKNTWYRISAKALIFDESSKKFLCFREDNGKIGLPGGGVDWGELPKDTVIREMKEEAGLKITWISDAPVYMYTFQNRYGEWMSNVVYEAKLENLNFTPSDECVEVLFLSKEEAATYPMNADVEALLKHIQIN